MYDMATVNLVELPSKTWVGAPAPRASAPCYPSYTIAPQQVEACEDTISLKSTYQSRAQLFLRWRLGLLVWELRRRLKNCNRQKR